MSVVVVGLGACTSVGLSAAETALSVHAGITRYGEHPYMIDLVGAPMIVARAAHLPDDLSGVERYRALALPAAQEALAPLGAMAEELSSHLLLGLPEPRPGVPPTLSEAVARELMAPGALSRTFSTVETVDCGHAAGMMAVGEGWRRIDAGEADFCLAGGVDSYLEPETLEWLDIEGQLRSERNRHGFTPGEAAGFCLLASERAARQIGLQALGVVLGAATAMETKLRKTDGVCIGEGLTAVFRETLSAVEPGSGPVDRVICDLNGERYRANEYGFTVARTSDRFVDASAFVTPADCWGDVGAASGPLFVALATVPAGRTLGSLVLVWASSEKGERSAALLRVDDREAN